MPYAYDQPSGYGYDIEPPRTAPPPGRIVIIGAAILLAVICAFACGLLFGFEIIPDLLGIGAGAAPSPTKIPVTPSPTSLLLVRHILLG